MINILNANGVDQFKAEIATIMSTEPASGAALIADIDTLMSTDSIKKQLYLQFLKAYTNNTVTVGGQLVDGITITDGGTGYSVGDILLVTGATSGEGGSLIVTSVNAGVIDGIAINKVGNNYVGALTVGTVGVGNEDAIIAMDNPATYEDQAVTADAIATLEAL